MVQVKEEKVIKSRFTFHYGSIQIKALHSFQNRT